MTPAASEQAHTPMHVLIRRNGEQLRAGVVCFRKSPSGGGWQFVPTTTAHQPSRKLWDKPTDAIPRWLGDYTLDDPAVGDGSTLTQRLNRLSHNYGYDSQEARDLGEAGVIVARVAELEAALGKIADDCDGDGLPIFDSRAAARKAVKIARAALAGSKS